MKTPAFLKSLCFSAAIFFIALNTLNAQPHYVDITAIDKTVKPGDDFYNYANGNRIKTMEIPASEVSWGSWDIVRKQISLRLQELIQETASKKNAAGSNAQKIADFYRSGMDTAAIERLGIQPIQADLQQVSAIKDMHGITEAVIAQYATGITAVTPLFTIKNYADPIMNDVEIITFSQGGMGLPEKSFYFDADEKAATIRNQYQSYLQQLLQLSGIAEQEATLKAKAILELEIRLAKGARTATENRDLPRLLNYYTTDKLNQEFPAIAWNHLFQQLNIQAAKIIVGQPEFFSNLNTELTATPLITWKDYLTIRLLSNAAPYLSSPFAKANFAFYSTTLTGQVQMKPRSEQMANTTDAMLGEMLGRLYVEKYFTADVKKRIDDMVENIISTFGERIKSNDWMTDSTKEKALQKLSAIRKKIAYPDKWRDYSSVTIGSNYYENVKATSAFEFKYQMNLVGKPVDRDQWTVSPPTLNAFYNVLNNDIVFPAGILLPPFFDPSADDAVNYGGIGTLIGHEVSHGFDDRGSLFDGTGRFNNWWTTTDRANFDAKSAALANQFDQYVVLDTLHENGKLTLSENIADLCGVTVAYQAFKKTAEGKSSQLIDGLTPGQRFFLSYAAIWRTKGNDDILRTWVLTNEHAVNWFRVNGPLSNLDAFYSSFNVKEDDKMWRPANERIVIW